MRDSEPVESPVPQSQSTSANTLIVTLLVVFIFINICLCFALAVLFAQRRTGVTAPAKNVVAEKFTLVDKSGKALGEFMVHNGMPDVALFDGVSARSRLDITLTANGDPCINFFDREQLGTMVIGMSFADTPGILLRDKNQKPRMTIALQSDGTPLVHFYDLQGNVQFRWDGFTPSNKQSVK